MMFSERGSIQFYEKVKQSKYLSLAAVFGSVHLIWLMAGFALAYYYQIPTTDGGVCQTCAVFLFSPILLPWGVSLLLSELIHRARPFRKYGFTPLVKLLIETKSFPSEHTTIAFAMAAIFLQDMTLFPFFLVAAILVGLSRVAAGVHYFSDIFSGAVIGFLIGYAAVIASLLLS